MLKRYTKGDKDNVVTRIEQVSDVTLYIPTFERCVDYLYDGLILLCNHYVDGDNNDVFLHIPAIDFYNVVLYSNKCCKENGIDTNYISAMLGVVRSFTNLKHVSVVFKDDIELRDSYERLININTNNVSKSEVINELTNIYSIDVMEMFLGDMFDQKIIDLINKSFISNGIISNSYLERDFLIEFEFDEYISYINMFVDNNIDRLSMLDEDIMDYLRVFPSIIGDVSKPVIKLYTNYKEI
jgi:predicted CopG family antitoxin